MTRDWYPIIDYGKCMGCLTCVHFCPHGVLEEREGKPYVKDREACVDMCRGCEKICPEKAIIHATTGRNNELPGGSK